MTVDNTYAIVSNYCTEALQDTLDKYGEHGYKLVNIVLAKNKYNVDVMYCFFTKELTEEVQEPILKKIRAEIEALPKTYPFVNHFDMYVKEDDVEKIIDKYKAEREK